MSSATYSPSRTASPADFPAVIPQRTLVMSPVPSRLIGGETPFVPFETPIELKEDWQLMAELLPVKQEGRESYVLKDIAPVIGKVHWHTLSDHAQRLWPDYEGHYKLNFIDAVFLIRGYLENGRRRFNRDELEATWRRKYLWSFQPTTQKAA